MQALPRNWLSCCTERFQTPVLNIWDNITFGARVGGTWTGKGVRDAGARAQAPHQSLIDRGKHACKTFGMLSRLGGMGGAGGAGTWTRCVYASVTLSAPRHSGRIEHTQRRLAHEKKVRQSVLRRVLCASAPFAREDEVDQRRLMSPASHGRCTARKFTVVRHTCEALPWPHRSPVTATSGGYVRVHTARHRMQDLWLCVFSVCCVL
jgi:hypothetical protein